ncbi:hypothetical protein Tco_1549482 [Tanacetum coccineum]
MGQSVATSASLEIWSKIGTIQSHKDPLFDEIPEDSLDYMETEDAQDEGRTRAMKSTDEQRKGTDAAILKKRGLTADNSTTYFYIYWSDVTIAQTFETASSDEEMARKVQEEQELKLIDFLLRSFKKKKEEFTIKKAKFLHDTIAAQRKFLAQQRSEAIRNRPPTKNQLRNQMMTYLKHVGNFKHSDLKTKKFEEYKLCMKRLRGQIQNFISIGSAEDERLIKKMNEKGIDSSKNEMVKEEDKEEEGTKKRKGGHIKMIARKKARKQSDVDSEDEHKKCLKIVTFESILDSEIMEKKSVIARLNKVSSPDGDYLRLFFSAFMFALHSRTDKTSDGPEVKAMDTIIARTWNLVDRSLTSAKICPFSDIVPSTVDTRYSIELADGKIIEVDTNI